MTGSDQGVDQTMRDFISRHLFSPLQGMTFNSWWSLLRRSRFAVDPRYWPRAAFQTAITVANLPCARREERKFGSQVEAVEVLPPVFILGHWRQGTTHLHNLLALDPQFAYPTLFQTLYPRSFLTTEAFIPRLGSPLLLRRRPHDNVKLDFGVPNEDELALCTDMGLSSYLTWAFPKEARFYDRFLTLEEATDDERLRWRSSLLHFLKKLTLKSGRPLVLKSPPHTARIGLLLDLFPTARFVHIRRDPYLVFRSTTHMYALTTMRRYWQLQRPVSGCRSFDDRIIAVYRTMYDAFFDQWPSIPPSQRLRGCLRRACPRPDRSRSRPSTAALGLSGFADIRPQLDGLPGVRSRYGYELNKHSELPESIRERIAREWERCFQEWGYAP